MALLHEKINVFRRIGVAVYKFVLPFSGQKESMMKFIHNTKKGWRMNGSICEIEPGKKFISVKCICQVETTHML